MSLDSKALSMKRPHLQLDLEYEKQIKKDEHVKAYKNPPEIVTALSLAAKKKADTPIPTLTILSVWSGLFIAIGGAASLVAAGGAQYQTTIIGENGTQILSDTQVTIPILPKFALSAVFPIGLILILLLGGELFTGNTMYMAIGVFTKKATIVDLAISWVVSWIGNYAGCVIGALAFWGMGALSEDPYHAFLCTLVEGKTNTNFGVNLLKAIPCNFLVCVAVALANASEDISGKIIGAWWPIFTFVISGFEHSIANQFFMTVGAFYGAPINYGTFIWQNLIPVTIGNTIGGVLFMAVVMWHAYYKPITTATKKDKESTPQPEGDIEMGKLPAAAAGTQN